MLFDPIKFKELTIKNRIIMAPMCMYAVEKKDGMANDWHFIHYGSRAVGGTGLIILEATGVEPVGRISDYDLGLWKDEQIEPLKRIVDECKKHGAAVGIQLAHAGRKSEVTDDTPVAPTSMEWNNEYKTPRELSKDDINKVINKFKEAAQRADKAGFDVIELHGAHGYLINEFLSPLSNKRTDEYGGSTENRVRFLKEVLSAIKSVWPDNKPIFLRVSASDYIEGGIDINEMIKILSLIKEDGIDLVHVSSGGILNAKIDLYPGYQVQFSERIKKELGFKTAAVGLITQPELAEDILRSERADMVALARELLRNPYWPLQAAKQLRYDIEWPKQYERAKLK